MLNEKYELFLHRETFQNIYNSDHNMPYFAKYERNKCQ